jgi:hypothetical protein
MAPGCAAKRTRKPSVRGGIPAKATSKVVLYVPDTFDPEAHLPEGLRHLADYARYLLHRIIVGRVHLRRGDHLVYLKHDYLRRFMPKGTFTEIRDALVESGVIAVRKFCRPGEISYGYRLRAPHDQGFHHHRPTATSLVEKFKAWRKRESDELRHPVHRELRRHLKALTIDVEAAIPSVKARGFRRAVMLSSIRRIAEGDFYVVPDRFGRFHSNLTNLSSSLRPYLCCGGERLVNLDIANSQPMIFCLLLVNLLSNGGKLDNLLSVEFPEANPNPYNIEIDEGFLSSLPERPNRQEDKREGGINGDNPILREKRERNNPYALSVMKLRQDDLSQRFPHDVVEFIDLCERGVLYDDLMRRLEIPFGRRKSFKRLFYAQVFFGRVRETGRVRQLFARDFPTVYQAVCDLKRKDHRQMAYLLQAHESKLMIDLIARRILAELPGAFVGTIHDSIMTTTDRAEAVRAIMVEEFGRFGLRPTIRLEAYQPTQGPS